MRHAYLALEREAAKEDPKSQTQWMKKSRKTEVQVGGWGEQQ
jgi:hypothetical protein